MIQEEQWQLFFDESLRQDGFEGVVENWPEFVPDDILEEAKEYRDAVIKFYKLVENKIIELGYDYQRYEFGDL